MKVKTRKTVLNHHKELISITGKKKTIFPFLRLKPIKFDSPTMLNKYHEYNDNILKMLNKIDFFMDIWVKIQINCQNITKLKST